MYKISNIKLTKKQMNAHTLLSKSVYKTIAISLAAALFFYTFPFGSADYKDEFNPNGEMHSPLEKVKDLSEWIDKHCDEQTKLVAEKVRWYARYQGIREEVPFAISWADSRCGQDLTTANNYGNVGNTDSGARMGFKNAFRGWISIIDTLNNQNMHGIEKVGHLSQGGRNKMVVKNSCYRAPAPYKCYASSEYNWNANVLRALRVINGDDSIDENFLIRLPEHQ